MSETTTSSLGNAITALGLEDEFLVNGELKNFPLVERVRIASDIVSEKLRIGRWQTVIRMIYGGLGKADALYEGDYDQLREDIFRSAIEHPEHSRRVDKEAIDALAKAGENDLLYRLATTIQFADDDNFIEVSRRIGPTYFTHDEEGTEKLRVLHGISGRRALEMGKYDSALVHFSKAEDMEGLAKIFDIIADREFGYVSRDLLIKVARSDPEHEESRLKKIILNCGTDHGLRTLEAFELYKKHNVTLTDEEKESLHEKIAKQVRGYEIEKLSPEDPENEKLQLLWAKRNTKSDPQTAYAIFVRQDFNGSQIMSAVRSGLEMERYNNEGRVLNVNRINENHLRRVYKLKSTSPKIKARIASHLKDMDGLQELSRQARDNGDFDTAYRLWVEGDGDLDSGYIGDIRAQIIADMEKVYLSTHFLDGSDLVGKIQVYDILMGQEDGEGVDDLRKIHDLALDIGDEERTQRVREAMVGVSPTWALETFIGYSSEEGVHDEKGVDYVLGVVADEHGVEQKTLRGLVDKYQI